MRIMKHTIACVALLLVAGCSSPKGLARLQGVWLVDVKSTTMEHSLGKQVLGWDDHVTPDNLSRIHYEFDGDDMRSFICYQQEDDSGFSNKVSVYEQDQTSVTLLIHDKRSQYSSEHPPLDELIKRDPLAAMHAIRGLVGFEFTKKNEAKLFYVAIDAKRNESRKFSGIHLVRADGPAPKRKKQLPRHISLEDPSSELHLMFSIPADGETWDVTCSTIDQSSSGGTGGNKTHWDVYTTRNPKGIKVTAKYRWDSGRCEASFIVPYEKDSEGHLNGITYKASWREQEKANTELNPTNGAAVGGSI